MTKRIAILGCLLASIFFLATAEKRNVSMDFHQKMKPGTHTGVDRAPARINLEVYYNENNHSVDVYYDGVADGEVFIYQGVEVVGYDSQINTTLQVPNESGIYKIEIISSSWSAYGEIVI